MRPDPADFDLKRLKVLRRAIADLDPTNLPGIRLIDTPEMTGRPRLGLLPGSFNPPTMAHLALAESALASGLLDAVSFSLATRTVNKERVEGMSLDDRLLLLHRLVQERPRLGVSLVNRGLYVEQAAIVRDALPNLASLWFLVGFDKIVQIFDPRYYTHRDQSLERLFSLASILVAPRGDAGFDDLDELLERPENRRFRENVIQLPVPENVRDVSSSRVRDTVEGAIPEVPPAVERFIETFGVYGHRAPGQPKSGLDRYGLRVRLIDLAVAEPADDIRGESVAALWERVTSLDGRGTELLDRLDRGVRLAALVESVAEATQ